MRPAISGRRGSSARVVASQAALLPPLSLEAVSAIQMGREVIDRSVVMLRSNRSSKVAHCVVEPSWVKSPQL